MTGHALYLYRERRTVKHKPLPPTRALWCTWKVKVVVHPGKRPGHGYRAGHSRGPNLGAPAVVPEAAAALSAKYPGEGVRQSAGAGLDFDVVCCHQPAVDDAVAPGRLRGLTARADLPSTQCGPGKTHHLRQMRAFTTSVADA
jgi:hypothetical protein